jgi:flagellar M-ring protein FliF
VDLKNIVQEFKNRFKDKNSIKNIFLALSAFAVVLIVSALLFKNVSSAEYGVLYTNLSPDDAGKILSVLQEERVPYKIEGDGSIILVPKDKLYDIRLKLAAKGLPSSENVGFEIFNEPKMGTTHFQENVNYLRAIEGELARTIKRIDAIKDTKVNIALPQDTIFAREEDEAKASVIVSLWPGKDLTKEQVKAIVFLVSHAVPKLKPQNVTVVDNRGRVLSDMLEESEEEIKDIVDIKKKLKKEIEKSVQSMLARALGPQSVVVRASVDVETADVSKKDEVVNPDLVAVVSERKIQEKEKGFAKQPLGAPGTPTNVPATIRTDDNNLIKDKSKKDTTTNYDITKSYIITKQKVFKIKRLSVGVLIDGRYKVVNKNGSRVVKFVPRSKAEIKAYEKLIKSAVGFDEKRGDKVTVVSVPFENKEDAFSNRELTFEEKVNRYGIYVAIGVLLLLVAAFAYYYIRKAKKAKEEELARLQELAAARAQQKAKEMEGSSIKNEEAYKHVLKMAKEKPDIVAGMISKWLRDDK